MKFLDRFLVATKAERRLAVPMVIALVCAPSMADVAWQVIDALAALVAALFFGVHRQTRGALNSAALSYVCGWARSIELLYAAFILVIARTPTKMN